MRRLRARRREGAFVCPVVVSTEVMEWLVAVGLLPLDQSANREAVAEALHRWLEASAETSEP